METGELSYLEAVQYAQAVPGQRIARYGWVSSGWYVWETQGSVGKIVNQNGHQLLTIPVHDTLCHDWFCMEPDSDHPTWSPQDMHKTP